MRAEGLFVVAVVLLFLLDTIMGLGIEMVKRLRKAPPTSTSDQKA